MLIRKLTSIGLLLGLVLSVACQKKDKGLANGIYTDELKNPAIFATRPNGYGKFVALFRLKNPALFEALKTENLKKTVDKELQTKIEAEQTQFINALKSFNPEIVVIMKYKYLVNGVAALVTEKDYDTISEALSNITSKEVSQSFARPMLEENVRAIKGINLTQNNSALFIGAKHALDKNIKGQGIRIGIVDSGVDYTHAMLGGSGKADDYKFNNPSNKSDLFPNQKVVGGYDFVGSDFGSVSNLPKPDENPIDEQGHGTHVAGTIGGIGDGVNSYDGIAPDAQLYSLKVFGKAGGTSDEVVIAALEYAADPNGDGNIDDRLDVINMSLGSSFGSPRDMYRLAIKNLTLGGTVVVAAAGNAGDTSYIVGAPSISEEALSVAASVDGMDHNWKFTVIEFFRGSDSMISEFTEGAVNKPISELNEVKEKLVYLGTVEKEITPEQAALVKGNVAAIDRGGNTFYEKMQRALAAGATGIVMMNNQDGEPVLMGGPEKDTPKLPIPGVFVSKTMGEQLKQEMAKGDVYIQFKTQRKVEKPELIDTMASFSSRGPRAEDSLIKPEITAPGEQIISAAMGSGSEVIPMSGTSMAGPHIAGVMGLMKQFYPELTVTELKSVVMGTSTSIHDEKKHIYSVSRMGAGRVQVDKALETPIATQPASLSLGEVRLESKKVMYKEIQVRNTHPEAVTFAVKFDGHPAITINEGNVTLPAKGVGVYGLKATIDVSKVKNAVEEIDGFVLFTQDGKEMFRLPVLAVVRKISQMSAQSLTVYSTSQADSDGAMAELAMKNDSIQPGQVVPMNLIALDDRKYASPTDEEIVSKACDIQAVGYKILQGKIYFGFKLYQPLTTWHACELSVLFDTDDDGKPDQELAGASIRRIPGFPVMDEFASMLLDFNAARMIRTKYEMSAMMGLPVELRYMPALQDVQPMLPLNHSTIALVVADISKIKVQKSTGLVSFKIASSSLEQYNVEGDDYLENDAKAWRKLDLTPLGQSYVFSELSTKMDPNSQKTLAFTKGHGKQSLMLLMPDNRSLNDSVTLDEQLDILNPKFKN